jgi:hypothetical protein
MSWFEYLGLCLSLSVWLVLSAGGARLAQFGVWSSVPCVNATQMLHPRPLYTLNNIMEILFSYAYTQNATQMLHPRPLHTLNNIMEILFSYACTQIFVSVTTCFQDLLFSRSEQCLTAVCTAMEATEL